MSIGLFNFRATNMSGLSFNIFFEFLHCKFSIIVECFNIFTQLYSFIKYLLDFEATNLFGYSFIKEK